MATPSQHGRSTLLCAEIKHGRARQGHRLYVWVSLLRGQCVIRMWFIPFPCITQRLVKLNFSPSLCPSLWSCCSVTACATLPMFGSWSYSFYIFSTASYCNWHYESSFFFVFVRLHFLLLPLALQSSTFALHWSRSCHFCLQCLTPSVLIYSCWVRCRYFRRPQLLEASRQSKIISGETVNPTQPFLS